MKDFNKVIALDELSKAMALPAKAKPSECIQSMLNAQDYLQALHDKAFEQGFEKGCEATKKVDEL